MMKLILFAGVTALVLSSCADQVSNQPAATTANPSDRTYTKQNIQRSGENTTGGAARKLEPAATVREN